MIQTQGFWRAGVFGYRDQVYSHAIGRSIFESVPFLAALQDMKVLVDWQEDFFSYLTTHKGLTSTLTDSGTAAVDVAAEWNIGAVKLTPSDGSVVDNDEAYVGGTNVFIRPAATVTILSEFRIKFSEAATDDANVMVGLSSTYAANAILDNGGGPPANYSGAVIFKVDGGTVWQAENSTTTSQATTADIGTRLSGTYQRLGIVINGTRSIDYYVDGIPVANHDTYLPAAGMGVFMGVKNGSANNEGLFVDSFRIVILGAR